VRYVGDMKLDGLTILSDYADLGKRHREAEEKNFFALAHLMVGVVRGHRVFLIGTK
jgi:hypothetical protein